MGKSALYITSLYLHKLDTTLLSCSQLSEQLERVLDCSPVGPSDLQHLDESLPIEAKSLHHAPCSIAKDINTNVYNSLYLSDEPEGNLGCLVDYRTLEEGYSHGQVASDEDNYADAAATSYPSTCLEQQRSYSPCIGVEGCGDEETPPLLVVHLPNELGVVFFCTYCKIGLSPTTTSGQVKAFPSFANHWRNRGDRKKLVEERDDKDDNHPALSWPEREQVYEVWVQYHQTAASVARPLWPPPAAEGSVAPRIPHFPVKPIRRCLIPNCKKPVIRHWQSENRAQDESYWSHMNREHSIRKTKTGGRPGTASALWLEEEGQIKIPPVVPGQQLFLYSAVVEVTGALEGEDVAVLPTTTPKATLKDLFPILQQEKDSFERLQKQQIPKLGSCLAAPWIRTAGFAEILAGYEWIAARRLADRPDENECPLALVMWQYTASMLLKAHNTMQQLQLDRMLLIAINAYSRIRTATDVPWTPYNTETNTKKYMRHIQGCMALFVYTQEMPQARECVPPYASNPAIRTAYERWRRFAEENLDRVENRPPLADVRLDTLEILTLELFILLLQQQDGREVASVPLDDANLAGPDPVPSQWGIQPDRGETGLYQPGILKLGLTVLTIQPRTAAFLPPSTISSLFSGFAKLAKGAVGKYIVYKNLRGAARQELLESCLYSGHDHVVDWVHGLQVYLSKVGHEQAMRGKLLWIAETQTMLYKESQISLSQLRSTARNLIRQAQEALAALFFVPSLDMVPSIDLCDIVDQANDHPGYSCWTDARNREHLGSVQAWYLDHIAEVEASGTPLLVHPKFPSTIYRRGAAQFEAKMITFRDAMAAAAVFVISISIRGTTISNYRWRNSRSGTQRRNLVVQQGRMFLQGGWTKTTWAGITSPLQLVPDEMATLWAWYLGVILPTWEGIHIATRQQRQLQLGSLLFPPKQGQSSSQSDWISRALQTATAQTAKRGFGLQHARQLTIGFARKYMPDDIIRGAQTLHLDARQRAATQQEQINARVTRLFTQDTSWKQEAAVRHEQDDGQGDGQDDGQDADEEEARLLEETYTGPGEAPLDLGDRGKAMFDRLRNDAARRSVIEMATGHNTTTGLQLYAGDAHTVVSHDEAQVMLWKTVSTYWHWVLQLDSSHQRILPYLSRQASAPGRADAWASCEAQVGEAEARGILQQILQRPTASFYKKQWEALDVILNQPSYSLSVVLPTGGGKSSLFLLPAKRFPKRTILVVLPLVALQRQVALQCHAAGVDHVRWPAPHGPPADFYAQSSVILAAIEHLGDARFVGMVEHLVAIKQLWHIFLDEAHLVLTQAWRPAMQAYQTLVQYEVPKVFLSATLPVAMEREVYKGMGLQLGHIKCIRASTVRKNLAYRAVHVGQALSGQRVPWAEDELHEYLEQVRSQPSMHARRMIIFINDRRAVQALALRSQHGFAYYGKQQDQEGVLEQFGATTGAVLFATCAIELGVDLPLVGYVGCCSPESMLAFVQATGRGGRDGQTAEAVLLVGTTLGKIAQPGPVLAPYTAAMDEYAQEHLVSLELATCRRVSIDKCMDGVVTRTCCNQDIGEVLCDVCSHHQSPTTPSETSSSRSSSSSKRSHSPDSSPTVKRVARAREAMSTPTKPIPVLACTPTMVEVVNISPTYTTALATPAPSTPSLATPASLSVQSSSPSALPTLPQAMLRESKWSGSDRRSAFERIRDCMEFWQQHCTLCIAAGLTPYDHHKRDCTRPRLTSQQKIVGEANKWNSQSFRFANWTCCWICKMPQKLDGCYGRECKSRYSRVWGDAWAACLLRTETRAWYDAARAAYEQRTAAATLNWEQWLGSRLGKEPISHLLDCLVQMTEQFLILPLPQLVPKSLAASAARDAVRGVSC